MRNSKLKVIKGGRTRRSRVWLRLFALGIVVLVGFLIWNSLGHLSLLAAKVTVARHTLVKTGVPLTCVVIRDEWIVTAPGEGKYIALVEDGTRVRAGQVFARIEGTNQKFDLTAPAAGLILHGEDGREVLPLDALSAGTVAAAAEMAADPPVPALVTNVGKDRPVAAVIDNVRFQLVTAQDFYTEGKKQTLVSVWDGRELIFTISPREMLQHDSLYWVLWDAPALPDSLGLQRIFDAEMVTAELELVLVPEGALYTKDDQRGVFILFRGKPVFSPVEVMYFQDGMAGVSGLANGERVLSLPKWAGFAKGWWE